MTIRLVLLGPPGAGKGTQARQLAAAYAVTHVSTGEIFRGHLEDNTAIGRRIEQYMAAGALVPDDLTWEVVASRLGAIGSAGFLLDGFPRTLVQARALEDWLERTGRRLTAAVNLAVDDEVLVERLAARRMCPRCGEIVNDALRRRTAGPVCSRPDCPDEAAWLRRADDDEATVRQRLRVYHLMTAPLIGFYRERGLLHTVSGCDTPNDVLERIKSILSCAGGGE